MEGSGVGLLMLASWWHWAGELLSYRPRLSRLVERVRFGQCCAVILSSFAKWPSAAHEEEVWVVNTGSDDVSVVDTATSRVIATIPAGLQPRYLSFTPDGREAWVTNLGSRDISIIDAEVKRMVATLAPGGRPYDVGFAADGRTAVITDQEATHAVLANVKARQCFYAVTVGRGPTLEKVRDPFRLFPRI